MCFLIEETKGAFPLWLAPTQVKILPITDNQHEYAHKLEEEFMKKGIRVCFLIEETKGAFPLWLAPTQVKILPITDNQHEYAHKLEEEFMKKGIRVEVDDRNEKTGYKIREAQLSKVPYMLIVGAKEVEEGTVSIRSREDGDIGTMKVDEFEEKVLDEIERRKR